MQTVRRIPYYGSLLLLFYMPFHVFLSQSLSLLTGGLNEWKVAKDIALVLLCLLTLGLVWWERKATKLFNGIFVITAVYALLNFVIWVLHPHAVSRASTVIGGVYDLRLFGYLMLGYGAALLEPVDVRQLKNVLLAVSLVVAGLGVLQYFLPTGILTHVGYSVARGALPNFFIDSNPAFPRIMSTLRDPNSLGAYLVLPVALLTITVLRAPFGKRRLICAGLLLLEVIAVYLTFSRSAWAGAAMVVVLVTWWQYRKWSTAVARRYWPMVIAVSLLLVAGAYSQRNNPIISHQTNLQSPGTLDSNQAHLYKVKHTVKGVEENPLGHGPGTAGLASIHTTNGSNLTENYYLQVGYETGILGLLIFTGTQILVYVRLWPQRHRQLGLALLASFWAYVLINLVLQQWDNEAVAAQWWIVAGIVLGVEGFTATRQGHGKQAQENRARTKKSLHR